MSDSYYDETIEKEKRKINVLVRVIDVAMDYLEPKNKRKQNIIHSAWTKVKYAENAKERNARLATFLHVLNEKDAFKEKATTSHEISQTLRNRLRGTNIELDYNEFSTYGYEISGQVKLAIAKFAREYVDAVNHIDSLRRQKESQNKREQERQHQEELETFKEQSKASSTPKYDDVYASVTSYESDSNKNINVLVNGQVIFHNYDEFEVREKKAIEYLERKIATTRARSYGKFFLTTEEEKMLNRVLGEGKSLRVGSLLEEGLSMRDVLFRLQQYERDSKIPFKKTVYRPNLGDVLMVASSVYLYLPDELFTPLSNSDDQAKFETRLRNISGMSKGLETYEKIYAMYLNYFNGLPDEEKNKIKTSFMTEGAYEYYKKQFNITSFEIVSPSKLKVLVNSKIKDKMLESFSMYMSSYHYNDLLRAVTYMSIEEVASLYSAIKAIHITYSPIDYTRDVDSQIAGQEWLIRELLNNFVKVILVKMNLGNLSNEEKNKKVEYIVKEILHENISLEISGPQEENTPVEEDTKEDKTVKSSDGMYHYVAGGKEQKTTNKAMAARYNAQNRFFGMSKLEQTAARMSGKWGKFKQMWEQAATMDKEKQDEVAQKLDLMFRR